MKYLGRVPAPPLDRLVDDVYCLTGVPRHRVMSVPPMPSAHLFINLGEPGRLWGAEPAGAPETLPDAWVMGVWTRRFLFEYPAAVRLVGVHFKPWGLAPFLALPAAELHNGWMPADDGWRAVADRVRGLRTAGEALAVVERELRARLAGVRARHLGLVRYTGGQLATAHGALRVEALADGAGVSASHLAAQFKAHIGVTPKRVARIYRFARLILAVDGWGPVDWPALAHAAGYFDQAHFVKEFKDFTGHTPTQYLALRRRFPAEEEFPPLPAD